MTPTLDILKTVAKKLNLSESDDCTYHTGWTNRLGYSQLQFCFQGGKYNIETHRAAYMLYHNVQLSKDNIVMHMCDNPGCMNPKHLKMGTHNDNVQDRVKKNRSATGTKNGRYVHGKYVKGK